MNFMTLLQCSEDRQRSKAEAVSYAEVGSQNRGSVVGDVDMMEFSSSPHGFLGRGTTILIPSLRLKGASENNIAHHGKQYEETGIQECHFF